MILPLPRVPTMDGTMSSVALLFHDLPGEPYLAQGGALPRAVQFFP